MNKIIKGFLFVFIGLTANIFSSTPPPGQMRIRILANISGGYHSFDTLRDEVLGKIKGLGISGAEPFYNNDLVLLELDLSGIDRQLAERTMNTIQMVVPNLLRTLANLRLKPVAQLVPGALYSYYKTGYSDVVMDVEVSNEARRTVDDLYDKVGRIVGPGRIPLRWEPRVTLLRVPDQEAQNRALIDLLKTIKPAVTFSIDGILGSELVGGFYEPRGKIDPLPQVSPAPRAPLTTKTASTLSPAQIGLYAASSPRGVPAVAPSYPMPPMRTGTMAGMRQQMTPRVVSPVPSLPAVSMRPRPVPIGLPSRPTAAPLPPILKAVEKKEPMMATRVAVAPIVGSLAGVSAAMRAPAYPSGRKATGMVPTARKGAVASKPVARRVTMAAAQKRAVAPKPVARRAQIVPARKGAVVSKPVARRVPMAAAQKRAVAPKPVARRAQMGPVRKGAVVSKPVAKRAPMTGAQKRAVAPKLVARKGKPVGKKAGIKPVATPARKSGQKPVVGRTQRAGAQKPVAKKAPGVAKKRVRPVVKRAQISPNRKPIGTKV